MGLDFIRIMPTFDLLIFRTSCNTYTWAVHQTSVRCPDTQLLADPASYTRDCNWTGRRHRRGTVPIPVRNRWPVRQGSRTVPLKNVFLYD